MLLNYLKTVYYVFISFYKIRYTFCATIPNTRTCDLPCPKVSIKYLKHHHGNP